MVADETKPHIKALRAYVAYKQSGFFEMYNKAKACAELIPELVQDNYIMNDRITELQLMYDESEMNNSVFREKIWELEQELESWEEKERLRLEKEAELSELYGDRKYGREPEYDSGC